MKSFDLSLRKTKINHKVMNLYEVICWLLYVNGLLCSFVDLRGWQWHIDL
ncbi:hypothetical protein HanPSC8_Chr13g0594251 [Helianthus annuus]|nr:hypothetical protein HanPSC8_Chr13g0594251 [Helianthus annuus]